jgi:hypothetical protein
MDAFQKTADELTAKREEGIMCVTAGFVNRDGALRFFVYKYSPCRIGRTFLNRTLSLSNWLCSSRVMIIAN